MEVGASKRVVHESDAQQIRVGRETRFESVSEFPGEQSLVVGSAHWVPVRKAGYGPVEAVAVQGDIVSAFKPFAHALQLAGAVRIVDLQLLDAVVVQMGEPLLPVLL